MACQSSAGRRTAPNRIWFKTKSPAFCLKMLRPWDWHEAWSGSYAAASLQRRWDGTLESWSHGILRWRRALNESRHLFSARVDSIENDEKDPDSATLALLCASVESWRA